MSWVGSCKSSTAHACGVLGGDSYTNLVLEEEAFTFHSYAAVQVWAQAVERAGTQEARQVSEVLKSEQFDTVLGKVSFDEKGDSSNPGFVIFYYNEGQKFYFE
jgi:branched-chain amino acid transport system substrate-binding protein